MFDSKSNFRFTILQEDKYSSARIGKLITSHGIVDTPAFVPVGTQASIKSLSPEDLEAIGVQILFGNTYHLHLRPGEDVIEAFQGIGKFMGFQGVTMTDSGGFQVFSLARDKKFGFDNDISLQEKSLVKITENGVEFRSHLDGSKHLFTPEQSILIQKKLGADIILAFDDCPPFPITYEGAKSSMERTHRWLKRSIAAYQNTQSQFDQVLYGIVQGSIYKDLRQASAKFITACDTPGIAIGGVAVGEGKKEMKNAIDWVLPILPKNKIKHLLGVGDVDDIFAIIERGVDTFDCVTPTRLGRVGQIFIHPPEGSSQNRFRLDITKSNYQKSIDPLSLNCNCQVCKKHSRGYLNHLFRTKELLAYRLATYHNVYFIIDLVKQIRKSIEKGSYTNFKQSWLG